MHAASVFVGLGYFTRCNFSSLLHFFCKFHDLNFLSRNYLFFECVQMSCFIYVCGSHMFSECHGCLRRALNILEVELQTGFSCHVYAWNRNLSHLQEEKVFLTANHLSSSNFITLESWIELHYALYHIFIIQSSVDRHLSCFRFLGIMAGTSVRWMSKDAIG